MRLVVSAEDGGATEGGDVDDAGLPLPAPAGPPDLADHYDLTISHPAVDTPQFVSFDRWLARAAADLGLSCALIHDPVVHEAVRRLTEGRLRIGYHLDYHALWHVADDPYARLAEAVVDAGGRSVNAPARSRAFTDKAAAHAELTRRGLGAPATVIVRPWCADRELTAEERRRLRLDEPGARVYVKPANGFSGHGVVRVERTDSDGFKTALAAARNHDRREAYLIQREVRPPRLACDDGRERPAYWRILSYLGELIPFWWGSQAAVGPGRPSYHPVSREEVHRHRLQPLLAYTRSLGELSGLEWFSTELCLGDGPEESRFMVTTADGRTRPVLAIDYLNDQCDVDVRSRWAGAPPDDVVRAYARRFARTAWEAKRETKGWTGNGLPLRLAA